MMPSRCARHAADDVDIDFTTVRFLCTALMQPAYAMRLLSRARDRHASAHRPAHFYFSSGIHQICPTLLFASFIFALFTFAGYFVSLYYRSDALIAALDRDIFLGIHFSFGPRFH